MKHDNQKALQGRAVTVSKGQTFKFGLLAMGLAVCLTAFAPAAKAITQLEFLQWMVQLTGDGASFSAASTSADFVQWARNRGMNPSGGWSPGGALTSDQLAQSLVQLYGLSSGKKNGDNYRILEREGIAVARTSGPVSRGALADLVSSFGFQSRTSEKSSKSKTKCQDEDDDDDDSRPKPSSSKKDKDDDDDDKSKSKSKSKSSSKNDKCDDSNGHGDGDDDDDDKDSSKDKDDDDHSHSKKKHGKGHH